MADTLPADMFIPEVAREYARQEFVENLSMMELMGPGADSPIQLVNDPAFGSKGEYIQRPVFKRIASLGTRRDLTSTSAVTDLELTVGNEKAVKVHKKLGGVSFSLDAVRLSGAVGLSMEIGKQFGENAATLVRDTLLSTIRGAIAAMTTTAHTHDVWNASARTNISPELIQDWLDKFDDRQEKVSALIIHNKMMGDLIKNYLGRGVQGVVDQQLQRKIITETLGRRVHHLTSSILTTADAGNDKYRAVALGPGAVELGFSLPLEIYPPFLDTSKEQVMVRARADIDYWVGVKGMGYNSGAGGANPTDATLLSSANWSVVCSDAREVLLGELVANYGNN